MREVKTSLMGRLVRRSISEGGVKFPILVLHFSHFTNEKNGARIIGYKDMNEQSRQVPEEYTQTEQDDIPVFSRRSFLRLGVVGGSLAGIAGIVALQSHEPQAVKAAPENPFVCPPNTVCVFAPSNSKSTSNNKVTIKNRVEVGVVVGGTGVVNTNLNENTSGDNSDEGDNTSEDNHSSDNNNDNFGGDNSNDNNNNGNDNSGDNS